MSNPSQKNDANIVVDKSKKRGVVALILSILVALPILYFMVEIPRGGVAKSPQGGYSMYLVVSALISALPLVVSFIFAILSFKAYLDERKIYGTNYSKNIAVPAFAAPFLAFGLILLALLLDTFVWH